MSSSINEGLKYQSTAFSNKVDPFGNFQKVFLQIIFFYLYNDYYLEDLVLWVL